MPRAEELNLSREQLDKRLSHVQLPKEPSEGWIRVIRTSLGMPLEFLAKKVGITKQALSRIERSEKMGAVTLHTLKKIGRELGCEVHLVFVPRQPLQQMVEKRAHEVAREIVIETNKQMGLEHQQSSIEFREQRIKTIAEKLINKEHRHLWRK